MASGSSRAKCCTNDETCDNDESESITAAEMYAGTFYWRIQNCGYLNNTVRSSIKFRTFSESNSSNTLPLLWHLNYYPRGSRKAVDVPGSPSLHLLCDIESGEEKPCDYIIASATISIGSKRNCTEIVDRQKKMFQEMKLGGVGGSVIFPELFSYDTVGKDASLCKLLENELVITCELRHAAGGADTYGHRCTNNVDPDDIRGDLLLAFMNEEMTDAEIVLAEGTKTFKVHKAILSARSSVFKALFNSEFKEASTNSIHIDDMSVLVCRRMLSYIYGSKIALRGLPLHSGIHSLNYYMELLNAAEKYELEGLKWRCCKGLCSMLSVENAAELLVFSSQYRAYALKDCCQKFIKSHWAQVVKSDGWEAVERDHQNLITEIKEGRW